MKQSGSGILLPALKSEGSRATTTLTFLPLFAGCVFLRTHMCSPQEVAIGLFVASGNLLHQIKGHSHSVGALSFCRTGKTLASCGENGQLKLWDVETGREMWSHEGKLFAVKAEFSPEGNLLLVGYADGEIHFRTLGAEPGR
jgi:WD40 repeat protein